MKPTLVVMAAGMGSRYGGVKQIDSVGAHGETLLDYSVYDALNAGFGKVVFVIRKDIEKDFRERLFDRVAANADATYVFQERTSLLTEAEQKLTADRKKPWGTVHCLLCSRDAVSSSFAVINSDDYYGKTAYSELAQYLSKLDDASTAHAMVGYLLKNTMSPAGSVARGVCNVKDGMLVNMRENLKIEYCPQGIVSHLPEGDKLLTGEEIVSMNLFGFSRSIFGELEAYFENFKRTSLLAEKAESLLPDCAGLVVSSGRGSIKVFSTHEKWFGMTYKEDRQTVADNLAAMTRAGIYPEKLWRK
ncbi:MAG: hypothetical protein PHI83_03025 [Sphaerochaetaceae bacterium]|jgi:UTP-glucose-1-phosphate uridylyltransferase|nr:hypothetical protein [Sphaerochaetaceae bacterium]